MCNTCLDIHVLTKQGSFSPAYVHAITSDSEAYVFETINMYNA